MAKTRIASTVLSRATGSFSYPLKQDDFRRAIPSERDQGPTEALVHIESLSVLAVRTMRSPSASVWKPKGME